MPNIRVAYASQSTGEDEQNLNISHIARDRRKNNPRIKRNK